MKVLLILFLNKSLIPYLNKLSYLHKDTSIRDQRMIMQVSTWWEYQQVRNHVILFNLFNTQIKSDEEKHNTVKL